MRLALAKERNLFGLLDDLLASLDEETRRAMLRAGLIDPSASVRSIATEAGIPVNDANLDSLLNADQALRGAAEAATLDTLKPVSSGDLDAGIALLSDLEAQHVRFERGEPLQETRLAAEIGKLDDLIASSRK